MARRKTSVRWLLLLELVTLTYSLPTSPHKLSTSRHEQTTTDTIATFPHKLSDSNTLADSLYTSKHTSVRLPHKLNTAKYEHTTSTSSHKLSDSTTSSYGISTSTEAPVTSPHKFNTSLHHNSTGQFSTNTSSAPETEKDNFRSLSETQKSAGVMATIPSYSDSSPSPPSLTQGEDGDENVDEEDAKMAADLLLKYGYFRKGKSLHLLTADRASHSRTERSAQSEAIKMYQSFFGLEQTGTLTRETIQLMKRERCGVADIPEEEEEDELEQEVGNKPRPHHLIRDTQSPSDYTLLGTKWDRTTLTWRLDGPTNRFHPSKQRETLADAFATWAQVAPLKFVEKRGREKSDIDIRFESGRHGDDFPFDGRGKVLAHAFGPGEVDLSGDMHLDNDEQWALEADSAGSDLFLVATHELGHSLGLSHSRDPSALMYPFSGFTDKLGRDDIKAIQSLYGARIGPPDVTPKPRRRHTTTAIPTMKPVTRFPWVKSATYTHRPRPRSKPQCDVTFDVVIQDDQNSAGVYTGIQGDSVYRFDQGGLLKGYPSSLQSLYPGAPSGAEAVFALPEKYATYFIKDNKVWRFEKSRLDPAYPKDLNPSHFRETIRFVFPVTDTSGVQRIFVFGTTRWLEYNFDNLPSYAPHEHVIPQYWPYVSNDVNYAVTGRDNNIYFISPNSHVVLDSFRRLVRGGKKEGHPHWLQPVCHVRSVTSGSSSLHLTWSTIVVILFVTLLRVQQQ